MLGEDLCDPFGVDSCLNVYRRLHLRLLTLLSYGQRGGSIFALIKLNQP